MIKIFNIIDPHKYNKIIKYNKKNHEEIDLIIL